MASLSATAQETYQDSKLAENQLTGTARYIGMGGAMEALGADISTISTNPAGIGLFRKSQVSVSAGVIAQGGAETIHPCLAIELISMAKVASNIRPDRYRLEPEVEGQQLYQLGLQLS